MAADYYSVLGVPKSATKQDIKSAYRKLARKVLSDDQKKSVYDQYGEAGVKSRAAGGAGAYGSTNPYDLFETFFGGGMGEMGGMGGVGGMGRNRRPTVVQGDDVRYDMPLEFVAAIFGTEKEFEVAHLETCAACTGSGARADTSRKTCPTSGGIGQVMRTQDTPFGAFSQVSTCSTCGGEGEVIRDYCRKCGGEGRIRVKKNIKVKIPSGVNDGSTLRVRGEGDVGPRCSTRKPVFLNVKEMAGVQRDGINLYSTVAVSYTDAILGTITQVKTVGVKDLRIPNGTQPGDVLVMSKLGVPKLNKPNVRGDHFFTVKITIPTRLSEIERELVGDLAKLQKTKGRAGSVNLGSNSGSSPNQF